MKKAGPTQIAMTAISKGISMLLAGLTVLAVVSAAQVRSVGSYFLPGDAKAGMQVFLIRVAPVATPSWAREVTPPPIWRGYPPAI